MAEKKSKYGKGNGSLRGGEFVEFFANVKSKTQTPKKMPDENEVHAKMIERSITSGSGKGRR